MSSDYPHYVLTARADGEISLMSHLGEIAKGDAAMIMIRTLLYFPNKTVNPKYSHVTDSIMSMIMLASNNSTSDDPNTLNAGNRVHLDALASRFASSGLWGVLK